MSSLARDDNVWIGQPYHKAALKWMSKHKRGCGIARTVHRPN